MDRIVQDYLLTKLASNSALLGNIASYLTTPVATYAHSANKEVVVSAVDVTLNRLTSVAHGLSNTDCIYPVMNYTGGAIYPINVYPGGVTYKTNPGYYVKKIDNDTIELYTDVSLTTIVDIITNANMDLTKFHFELFQTPLNIIGLNASRYMVRLKGRILRSSTVGFTISPNSISESYWAKSAETTYGDSSINACGDISVDLDVLIDYTKHLTMKVRGIVAKSNTASANSVTIVDKILKNLNRREGSITNIQFTGFEMANGFIVEVYKA